MPAQGGHLCISPSRILLATALTDLERLIPVAIGYALKLNATLQLVHVLPDVNIADTNPSQSVHGDRASALRCAEEVLEDAACRAREAGVQCIWIARFGPVADTIRRAVQQWNADRLIVGSHGSRKFQQELLGTVAESILREVDIPVLAIGPAVEHYEFPLSRETRILFAAALDRESHAIAESVLRFAGMHRIDLTMLHVIPGISVDHPSTQRVRVYAERMFQDILSGIDADAPRPCCIIEHGQVVDTILRVAKQGQYDLIFLGAVSGSSFRRDIMPGTAYEVICRAPCPVLVIREPSHRSAAGRFLGGISETLSPRYPALN